VNNLDTCTINRLPVFCVDDRIKKIALIDGNKEFFYQIEENV